MGPVRFSFVAFIRRLGGIIRRNGALVLVVGLAHAAVAFGLHELLAGIADDGRRGLMPLPGWLAVRELAYALLAAAFGGGVTAAALRGRYQQDGRAALAAVGPAAISAMSLTLAIALPIAAAGLVVMGAEGRNMVGLLALLLAIIVGLALLVINVRWGLTPAVAADRGVGPLAAARESAELVSGRFWPMVTLTLLAGILCVASDTAIQLSRSEALLEIWNWLGPVVRAQVCSTAIVAAYLEYRQLRSGVDQTEIFD